MKIDLLVVGASFAGLACARAAARAGLHVVVIEKKQRAGAKLHTTGIIVKDAVETVPWLREVPPPLVRSVEGVRLYAPNLRYIDLFAPGYYFWATDAPALLDWMVVDVIACGATVRLGALFENAVRVGESWRVPLACGDVLEAGYLIGADGPHSRVAKALGLSRNTQFLFGIEHEYAAAGLDPGFLHCFIDKRLAPGYIGWGLAGVGVSQIGLARRLSAAAHGDGQARLEPLLAKVGHLLQPTGEPVAVRAGMIPCGGLLPTIACPRALLVGDAAGMVSPVTAGGIHTALQYGGQAGDAVAAFVRGEGADPASWLPGRYPRFGTKRLLRQIFDRFQADWIFDSLLSTSLMRRAAELIYFHRKGGVAPPR